MASWSDWKNDEKLEAALRLTVAIDLKHKKIFGLVCRVSQIMNRIRILCFNIVLGVHYIVKVSFNALINVYCFQKSLICTFSALDKIKKKFCSNI